MFTKTLMAALVSGLLATGAVSIGAAPAAAQAGCLSQTDMRSVLAAGQALSFAQLRQLIFNQVPGEVVSAQLCFNGSQYVYMVVVQTRGGAYRPLTVDAQSGTILAGY